MVAEDDSPSPSVRLGVRNCAVEDGAVGSLFVKLHAGDEGESWFKCESIVGLEPLGGVFESGALSGALDVISQCTDVSFGVAQVDLDGSLHGSFLESGRFLFDANAFGQAFGIEDDSRVVVSGVCNSA